MIKRNQDIKTIRPLRLVDELRGAQKAADLTEDFAASDLHRKAADEIERLYGLITGLNAEIRKLHIPTARGAAEIVADEIYGPK